MSKVQSESIFKNKGLSPKNNQNSSSKKEIRNEASWEENRQLTQLIKANTPKKQNSGIAHGEVYVNLTKSRENDIDQIQPEILNNSKNENSISLKSSIKHTPKSKIPQIESSLKLQNGTSDGKKKSYDPYSMESQPVMNSLSQNLNTNISS
jgi:hypothetical protein